MDHAFLRRLGLRCPILQAPMAGGADTPEMVIAVAEAGGLGSLACAYRTPARIRAAAAAVRVGTRRGFGVNLFAPTPEEEPGDHSAALRAVAPYFEDLGLAPPEVPTSGGFDAEAQIDAALDSEATVFSFTFGVMPAAVISAARARGMIVLGTATTVAEAVALEQAGVDAVIAQGAEAGGHRGTFLGDPHTTMVGTLALVPQVVDAVSVPVVAAGGIADGRGIAAVLALGASAAMLGTAFLTCAEAGIPDVCKSAILAAGADDTTLTSAFSGRVARGLRNRFTSEMETAERSGAVLPFPLQNALTRSLRAAAAQQGRTELLSLWAGQGCGLARAVSSGDLVRTLTTETEAALRRFGPGPWPAS